jgi:predicted RNase H-like nuclease (RuvC/YqgF family)
VADEESELTDELEALRGELERLKQEKEALARELASKEAAIRELEQALVNKDGEMALLRQALAESEQKLAQTSDALAQAVASYKELVVATNPEIPPELVTGDTIEAINQSLENARSLIDRVKQAVEQEASRSKVPVGAPQRASIDLSVLSPREKIQYAIGGKR